MHKMYYTVYYYSCFCWKCFDYRYNYFNLRSNKLAMDIKIMLNDNGYTWVIKELWIITEWDNFDMLLKNIKEAIECYYEVDSRKMNTENNDYRFYFSLDQMDYAY